MIELNGLRLGAGSEAADDYAAAQAGAALIELGDRGRMRFRGAGAKNALNGILTCDLATLNAGQGAFGVALTNKGKVVADVVVQVHDDSHLVECSPTTWAAWQQLVAKYINPRLAPRIDETEITDEFAIVGPESSRIVATVTGGDASLLAALEPYNHVTIPSVHGAVNVARVPDFGVVGYRLLGARDAIDAMRIAAIHAGTRAVGAETAECLRIEAGRPLWGVDMDDSSLPQEVNLEALEAISYTKGCYTGQEVVARLHFRGHVNRRLMGLRIDGQLLPERGAEITADQVVSGDIRSTAVSPRFGAIALAMVRREISAGDTIGVLIDGAAVPAVVVPLPFAS